MANLASYQKIGRVIPGLDFGRAIAGSVTVSSDTNTRVTLVATAGSKNATLGATGLQNGQFFLAYQFQGTGAGQYEINMVVSGGGTTSIVCAREFQFSYATGAQAVYSPEYLIATIGSHSVTAWNGTTGGVRFIVCKELAGSGDINGSGSAGSSGTSGLPDGGTGGYRGGNADVANSDGYGGGRQGEGYTTLGAYQNNAANTTGGGGGRWTGGQGGSGAGGGNGGGGIDGSKGNDGLGVGGGTVGSADLTTIFPGGGGAGGGGELGADVGAGGAGGTVVIIFAKAWSFTGHIYTNGGAGGTAGDKGGGGGAGGSTLIVTAAAPALGTNLLTATGGSPGANGGAGGVGRIAIHATGTISGTTNPSYTGVADTALYDLMPGAIFAALL